MKQFACGDVIPGCDAHWLAETEEALLAEVAAHAASAHGVTEVPQELVDKVRASIVTA